MVGVLRIERDGTVTAANEYARSILGPCVLRRCCDVVMARDGATVICTPDCAVTRADVENHDRRGVLIRGVLHRLVCTWVAGEAVVILIGPDIEVPDNVRPLSARERDVIGLVASGLSTKQIARRLCIGASTVSTHVSSALNKLGASSRAQAVAIAAATHQLE